MSELKTEYKHIEFVELHPMPKTRAFECLNKRSKLLLGTIKWQGGWRCYCYFTHAEKAFYDSSCLKDIADFIEQLMEERKKP